MRITGWTLRTYCRTTRAGLRSIKRLHNIYTVSTNYLFLVKLRCTVCKHHTTLITMLFVNTSFVSHATCRAKARSASALSTKAAPPVRASPHALPPEKTLFIFLKFPRRFFIFSCKGFSGGVTTADGRVARLWLAGPTRYAPQILNIDLSR